MKLDNAALQQARIYLQLFGAVSIPFLQRKFNISWELADAIMKEVVK